MGVPVTENFSAWVHPLQCPSFLTTVNLFTETDEELLVHHAVECQQRPGCFFPAIQTLGNRLDEYSVIEKYVVHAQDIRQVPCKP